MDLSSFLTSLATSFLVFVVLMFLFSWLSRKPGNSVVYYPNRILKGQDPFEGGSSMSRNPFTWIKEAFSSTEKDIIAISGVDTAVYFVFLSTALGILTLAGLVLLPILLPVAATDIGKISNSTTDATYASVEMLDKFSMGNVQDKSDRLWAYVFGVYWVSFITYYLLWRAYHHVSDLRANALMSPEVKAEQFAVLVRDIPDPPKNKTRQEQVDSYYKTLYPDTFYKSMVITDNSKVNKVWKALDGYKKKLAHAEAVYAESMAKGKSEQTRPMSRTALFGLFGPKVDTIEYCNEKITDLLVKLEAEQKVVLSEKQQASALVFFTSRLTAASAAQSLHARMVDTWTVVNAPEPRQVIWRNLKHNFYQRQIRQYVVYGIVALTIAFYMIPIGFISAFTTLANLIKLLPFLKGMVKQGVVRTVLEAYLPQLALIIFLGVLPQFLIWLSKAEGIPSKSHAVRAASGKYFYFTVLNVFIGVTLGGTIFSTFKTIQKSPNDIVPLLASSLPGNAIFFFTFVALKFFIGYGLELARLVPFIMYHFKRKYVCVTEDELKEAWKPGDLNYGTRIPGDLLILTIVFCYSVIAPIIIPFGMIYFGLGWLIHRNQALNVFVPSYESYGQMWPHIHTRIVAILILFQVTMFGYFGVNKFYYAPILIPLPICSFIFAFVCWKKFYRFFHETALEVTHEDLEEAPNMEVIFKAFIPPPLVAKISDDYKYQDGKKEDVLDETKSESSI